MRVQKLRVKANGLAAGAYFAEIAVRLEEMNAREAALRHELDEGDRGLEAMYRQHALAHAPCSAEQHALM